MFPTARKFVEKILLLSFVIVMASVCFASAETEDGKPFFSDFVNSDTSVGYVRTVPFSRDNRELLKKGEIEGWETWIPVAKKSLVVKHWYPKYRTDAVIAVNRKYCKGSITSWSDLLDCTENIGITQDQPEASYLLASMAYGLSGRKSGYHPEEAEKLLKKLASKGKLRVSSGAPKLDYTASVAICFDHEAAEKMKTNDDIEIIYPSEGTLSFVRGTVSDHKITKKNARSKAEKLAVMSRSALRTAGYRPLKGSGSAAYYPAQSTIKWLEGRQDYDVLNKYTENYKSFYLRDIAGLDFPAYVDHRAALIVTIMMILVMIFWMMALAFKCSSLVVNDVIKRMGFLCVGWLIFRSFSFVLPDSGVLKYFQFVYVIFVTLVSQEMLRLSIVIDKYQDPVVKRNRWQRILGAAAFVLCALVITNSRHHLFFGNARSYGRYISEGDYGALYFVTIFFNISVMIIANALLIKKEISYGSRSKVWGPAAIIALIGIYIVVSVTGKASAFMEDDTTGICLLALMMLECAMRSGIMTLDSVYENIFRADTDNRMLIVDNQGEVKYATAAMREFIEGTGTEYERSLHGAKEKVKDTAENIIKADKKDDEFRREVSGKLSGLDIDILLHDMTRPLVTSSGDVYYSARIPGGAVIDYIGNVSPEKKEDEETSGDGTGDADGKDARGPVEPAEVTKGAGK
ncbi:MAG: hypothetical protein ACI4LM_05755 [Anaerovoracaceae bacterium]